MCCEIKIYWSEFIFVLLGIFPPCEQSKTLLIDSPLEYRIKITIIFQWDEQDIIIYILLIINILIILSKYKYLLLNYMEMYF